MKNPICPKCKARRMIRGPRTPGGKQRWVCRSGAGDRPVCYNTTDPTAPYRGQDGSAREPEQQTQFEVKLAKRRVVVVTWAQNATPANTPFLEALKQFCKHRKAQLVVIPGRYKNPTSQWSASQANDEHWDPVLVPYLHNQRFALNESLVLAADVKAQPTATTPLTGFEGLTGGESCLIGHPKLQLKCIPTPQNRMPKILATTGSITVPNYTDSKAGKLGEFHHSAAAAIVEIQDGKVFHLRHVTADERGHFIDLDWLYTPKKFTKAPPYKGIVFGDAHYRFADPVVVEATFGKGGMVDRLNPDTLVWHDLLDAYAVSPHHKGNPFIALAKHREGFADIRKEVEETVAWLKKCTGKRKSVVVGSNHDDMLARWVVANDWRTDPENAEFYLETALHVARSAKMGPGGAEYIDAFQFWAERLRGKAAIRLLRRGESFMVGRYECGMHGHDGPNGARGSVKNLSRLGVRVISGHGHSPAWEEGHARGGTMTRLTLEYTRGPSSWLNTHVAVDALNRAHLLNIIDGRYSCLR
jgi:hypothetical protein